MRSHKKEIHLFLEQSQYERLKIEAEKENKKVSEIIRQKIDLGFITDEKIEKYLNKKLKLISNKIGGELEEFKNIIFSMQREFILNYTKEIKDISNNQNFMKEALKLIAFYSVYSSLFSTLKWQTLNPHGEISWEIVKEKREIWKKKADEIIKKIFNEGILNKIDQ